MTAVDPRARFRTLARQAAAAAPDRFDHVPETRRANAELSSLALQVAANLSDKPISRRLLTGGVRAFEGFTLGLIGFAAHVVRNWAEGLEMNYLGPIAVGALLAVLYIQAFDGYLISTFRGYFRQFGRIAAAWSMVFATFATIAFFARWGDDFSRTFFAGWYFAGLAFFALFRAWLSGRVREWSDQGRLERRAVIVGGGRNAEEVIRAIESQPEQDIRICGFFDDRADDRSPAVLLGYPKLGTVNALVEFARLTRLDMLIVTLPLTAESRVLSLLAKLWVLPLDIRLSAHSDKLMFRPRSLSYMGSVPLLDVFDKPLADWSGIGKRAFDLFFGILALIVLFPVIIGAAIAIRLDSKGPVLFRQKRFGFNNEIVEVLKFRSMYVDQADQDARKSVTKGDPRVTRVGRFIRKTSIDELPQLFNVLKGELSLVGPRPHAVNAQTENRLWDQVVDGYFARHKVKPGVTGWAQINGWRGEIDTPEKIRKRVEHDLYYIENWSLMFDLKILLLTPIKLLDTENAY